MTRDQVRTKFSEIVDWQVNKLVSEQVSRQMILSAKVGPRPNANLPLIVGKLWN